MIEKDVVKSSRKVFIFFLAISLIISIILRDYSVSFGVILGYIVNLLVFAVIVKTSDLILTLKSSSIAIVAGLFVIKLLLYAGGFLLAIKTPFFNLFAVFAGYFIVKATIYVEGYRRRGGEDDD